MTLPGVSHASRVHRKEPQLHQKQYALRAIIVNIRFPSVHRQSARSAQSSCNSSPTLTVAWRMQASSRS